MPAAMVGVQEQYALLFFGKERAPSESVLGVRAVPLFTELPRETVWKVGRRRLGRTFRRRAAAKQASLALLLASVRCQHGAIRNFQTVSRRSVLGNWASGILRSRKLRS